MTTRTRGTMIYHAPYPLDRSGRAASAIRPARMRDAFEEIGYEVIEITGHLAERRRLMVAAKRRIRAGERIEFLYSESSTMPTALTEPNHLPGHPLVDLSFLRFCRRRGIPTGLFYRDIHWLFPEYRARVNAVIALGTRFFYRWDLLRYRSALDVLFLPTQKMAEYLPPANRASVVSLPPASDPVESPMPRSGSEVGLFFVGGLGPFYRLHECVAGVALSTHGAMTMCVPEANWGLMRPEYAELLDDSTRVVHAFGSQLESYYAEASIGSLFVEPIPYWDFAAPMKMFEYLAHGKPMIASEGTEAGRFVGEQGLGWVIPYRREALAELMDRLAGDPREIEDAEARVREVRGHHTWAARARQAADALSAVG